MDRNELWRLIQQKEKEYDRKKFKRFIYTILLYAAVFFVLEFIRGGSFKVLDILGLAVGCIFIGGIFATFSAIIFGQLNRVSEAENKELERLKEKLSKLDEK